MVYFFSKNIGYIIGVILVCIGIIEEFNANGLLGYAGGILIILGGVITIFEKKRHDI